MLDYNVNSSPGEINRLDIMNMSEKESLQY